MIKTINQLVILAGPKCVGKSTFMSDLLDNEPPFIHKCLGTDENQKWHLLKPEYLDKKEWPAASNLIWDYDFNHPIIRNLKSYKDDSMVCLIRSAKLINFVTMWCPKHEMINRLNNQILKMDDESLKNKLIWLRWLYQTDGLLSKVYSNWFKFITEFEANNWLLLNSQNEIELSALNIDKYHSNVAPYI